jgi:hypothetical protein
MRTSALHNRMDTDKTELPGVGLPTKRFSRSLPKVQKSFPEGTGTHVAPASQAWPSGVAPPFSEVKTQPTNRRGLATSVQKTAKSVRLLDIHQRTHYKNRRHNS